MTLSIRIARWGLLCSVALSACRCGGKPTRDAATFVAPDATAVLLIPSAGALADKAQAFLASVRGLPGGTDLVASSANLATQLGFDPLTRDGLESAGIEPDASAALAYFGDERDGLAAIPCRDADKAAETIKRLAKDRAGAAVRSRKELDGLRVTIVSTREDGPALLAYAEADHFLLLASGPDSPGLVSRAAHRHAEESIASTLAYSAARPAMGTREAYLFLPERPGRGTDLVGTLMAGLSLGANELSIRVQLPLHESMRAVAKALLSGGDDLLTHLPAKSPMYARGGIDLAALTESLSKNESAKEALEKIRAFTARSAIDFDDEVIGNLTPGFALAMGLSPDVDLSKGLDPRKVDPLQQYATLLVQRVKDADKANRTLETVRTALEAAGSTITVRELAGVKTHTASGRMGEGLSWALIKNDLVVAGGFGDKLEQTLSDLQSAHGAIKATDFTPRARETLFRHEGLATYLDLGRLNDSVRELPDTAFGTGPGAFMARGAASGVLRQVSRLRLVAIAEPSGDGLAVELSASLK